MNMKHSQKGSVLIISLLLLMVATLISVAGISSMQMNERISSNQKQVSEAFIAAESGLIEVKAFFDDEDNNGLWGDPDAVLKALQDSKRGLGNNVEWQIETVDFVSKPGFVRVVSVGTVTSTGIERKVQAYYQPKKASGNLGAMNIIGGIKIFDTANSNKFQVIGEKDSAGKIIGPALATNTNSNYNKIVQDIEAKDRMDNYQGGIKVVDFDDPFGDPEKMNDFIESIKAQYYAMPLAQRGVAPDNMGKVGEERITYVAGNIEFKGKATGAGILVIDGNLTISGNLLDFEGLVVVRGQSFQMNGGGNRDLKGSIVFANPKKDAVTGQWSFGEAEATFVFDINGGGNATFQYDLDALTKARDLLKDDGKAKQMWQLQSGPGASGSGTASSMSLWSEVIDGY
ncbi:pilus assembly PilX family protein [Rheinheimera sp.]|uniref:pilus assembly PilX family protein n=1 Tax=Rheinheimera sp. TaxID=1869214 RepID=UPI002FDDBB0B